MKQKIIITTAIVALISCTNNETAEIKEIDKKQKETTDVLKYIKSFEALPSEILNSDNLKTEEKISLGHKLFFDTLLSLNGGNSCNSCHNLQNYGVDGQPFSLGDKGELGGRNSPTVLNAALHTSQFWDGRAKDVEEQAGMPILNPVEMAIPSKEFLVERLSKHPEYVEAFSKAFSTEHQPLTYENIQKAIGVFERELLTPSRFDAFLKGDNNALTEAEKKGFETFNTVGCVACHSGVAIGGDKLQKFGLVTDYWKLTNSPKIDEGRFEVTGKESDKYVFKVPSLRNIEKTAPYFHDGSISTLDKAVQIMAQAQLGKTLTEQETKEIVTFLKTLTGTVPKKYTVAP